MTEEPKPIAYLPHPVSPEKKREWTRKGYRIVDARFKPEGAPDAEPDPHSSDGAQKTAEAPAPETGGDGGQGEPETQKAEVTETENTITIPGDWADLDWREQVAIANTIKPDADITKKDEAIAVIQAAIAGSQQA
jgi:hypothetical protein